VGQAADPNLGVRATLLSAVAAVYDRRPWIFPSPTALKMRRSRCGAHRAPLQPRI